MNRRHVEHSHARLFLGTLILIVAQGCSGDGATNSNTDENSGVLEAEVSFPDTPSDPEACPPEGCKVVAIAQIDGIGGEFFGFAGESGEAVVITGFESDTGTEEFTAEFDDEFRLERVTIEELEVTFQYNADGTFDFVVRRGPDPVSSGSGLSVPRPNSKQAAGWSHRIDNQDIVSCRDTSIEALADVAEQEVQGDATATAADEFVECLQGTLDIQLVADMVCVSNLVLITAFNQTNCEETDDAQRCTDILGPAIDSSVFFSDICSSVVQDVIRQFRVAGEPCPTGEAVPAGCGRNDDCAAGAVCADGGCVALPAVCENDQDCDDGLFCDGTETCVMGACAAGQDPCGQNQGCNETTQACDEQLPVANAGPDQTIFGNVLVRLDGSASSDPNGDTLTYGWVQLSGSSVMLSGASTATPTFTSPNEDVTLIFELTVEDGNSGSSTDRVTIMVSANQAPTANAGADQVVSGGAVVTLDGSASSDPDGDGLNYSWTQTGGPTVLLAGADTGLPTFTAPNVDDTFTFALIVDDGNVGSSADEVVITVQAAPPVLFVANEGGDSVLSFEDPATLNGNVTPSTALVGASTLLEEPKGVVVTASDVLVVANFAGGRVTFYDDAMTVTGDVAPIRALQGGNTQLVDPLPMAIKPSSDILFVGNNNDNRVFVFDNASAVPDGDLDPNRTITSADMNDPIAFSLDAADNLYVGNLAGANVTVFAEATSAAGSVSAARTLEGAAFTIISDLFVDSSDRLYVVGGGTVVYVLDDASSLSGNVTADRTIAIVGATTLTGIVVGADGTGYIADGPSNAIYSCDNIGTLAGEFPPDRTIQGPGTNLSQPQHMFLLERE